MSEIKISVEDQNLHITDSPKIAAQGVNENYVVFSFSNDWDGFSKVAVFYADEDPETIYQSLIDARGYASIPWEVTNDERKMCIGVSGVKDEVVKTTEILKYKVVKGLYVVETAPPTPGIYEQILAIANQLAENTVFVGFTEDEEIELPLNTINDTVTSNVSTWSSEKIMASLPPFNFGIDEDGNYGYIDDEGEVIPFSGAVYDELAALGYTPASRAPEDLIAAIDGMYAAIGQTGEGTADLLDVLAGKTFTSSHGVNIVGTMPNNGAKSQEINAGESYSIPAGYHNGSGKVTAKDLESQTGVDSGKMAATAAAMLDGYQAWVNGNKVSGSIPSQAAQTITPGTSNQTIAAGKYLSGVQTIKGDSNLVAGNIKNGVSIFGVTGSFNPSFSGNKSFTLSGNSDVDNENGTRAKVEVNMVVKVTVTNNVISLSITSGNVKATAWRWEFDDWVNPAVATTVPTIS